jgi:peptide/nickel transport system substrate-binding protein
MNLNRLRTEHNRAALGLALALLVIVCAGMLAATNASVAAEGPAAPAAPRPEGNYGGNFRLADYEPLSLDPIDVDMNSGSRSAVRQIFEGLTRWGDDHATQPAIALSWTSSDAQNWTFYLRPGVRFHNGRLVTAQDVVYSWDRVAAAGNDWYEYLVGSRLSAVTAVNADTVEVALSEPFASLPSVLALPFMSVVPSETVGTIATNPIGSGPFQFTSWTPGDSIVVTHYDDYYGGRPYLDSISYQFYADEAAMYEDYLLGNLELSPVPSDRITEVVGSPDAIWSNRLSLYYYGMKVDWPPFDDVRVRQALNYAVDKPDIVDNIAAGYNVVAEGPVPSGMEGYDPPVLAYPHNPTQGLDLLAQAGWTDTNSDGILDHRVMVQHRCQSRGHRQRAG